MMATTDKLLDVLMKDYKKPEDLIGENGLLKQLTKRLLERAMQAELTEHLGYKKHTPNGKNSGNSRNGGYKKIISGEFGNLEISTPRDRNSTFEPVILPKGETCFAGFDDKIISMHARGMTTRDIHGHLEEIYGINVSPTFISQVIDAITEEVMLWQNRTLDEIYPSVYLDAVRIKVRHESRVINKAVYLTVAVNMEGNKEVLGMWTAENEGAKFWLQIVTELKNRGVKESLLPVSMDSKFP
jgi:putative transposase